MSSSWAAGQTEHRERLLPQQLLDPPPVAQDDLLERREPARDQPARRLDVQLVVDQQLDDAHRDDLPRKLRGPLHDLRRDAARHQRRVVLQDPPLQRPELLPRLHPRLLDDRETHPLVGGKRVHPPIRAVQREHLQPAQPLVRRVLPHQPVELADRLPMQPQLELRLEPRLQRVDTLLLEVSDHILGEAPVGEIRQRRAAPQLERLSQRRRPLTRRQPTRLAHQPLEPPRIDRIGIDPQPVPGRLGLQRVLPDLLPQAEHAVLHERRAPPAAASRPTARRSERRAGRRRSRSTAAPPATHAASAPREARKHPRPALPAGRASAFRSFRSSQGRPRYAHKTRRTRTQMSHLLDGALPARQGSAR